MLIGAPINLGIVTFPDPIGLLRPLDTILDYTGGERVPSAPLGWYSKYFQTKILDKFSFSLSEIIIGDQIFLK